MEPIILTCITFAPLLGAFLIFFIPTEEEWNIKLLATFSTFCSFLLSFYLFIAFDRNVGPVMLQFIEKIPLIKPLGISYQMGVDGFNLPMILLAGIISFTCILVSFSIQNRCKEYFILTLICISGVFGVFCTQDLFFFILFYEMASIPMYFLIGIWGSNKTGDGRTVTRQYSALKLIIYLQIGGGIILLGILGVYLLTAMPESIGRTFSLPDLMAYGKLARNFQVFLFPILFIGFAIEAGFWPMHTWLPDGHSAAPTPLSMILAGVLLKMGGYGMIKIASGLAPEGAAPWLNIFIIFGIINVLYGALCALNQKDLKYMIAYSSVSHMGIVTLGLCAKNTVGISGAMFQMFSHGVITALLFALAGTIYEKTHTRIMPEMGGLAARMPFLTTMFTLAALASLGLPGMSGFIAEVLVFMSVFMSGHIIIGFLAISGLVITATYFLRAVQKIFLGELKITFFEIKDASGQEQAPLILLALVMIVLGVYPRLLIDVMNVSSDFLATLLAH